MEVDLAVGRTLIAILENYQQKDGSIVITKSFKTLYEQFRKYFNQLKLFSLLR